MAVRAVRFIKGHTGSPLTDGLGLILAIVALAFAGPALSQAGSAVAGAELLLLPGLLLLAGVFGGRVAVRARLPRLTGYLIIGTLLGPEAWKMLSTQLGPEGWALIADQIQILDQQQVDHIKIVKDLAIGLIALMAGAEIRLSWLRQRLGAVLALVGAKTLLVPPIVMGLVVAAAPIFPFLAAAQDAGASIWLVGLLTGSIALASSPMVVVSVIKETDSKGPVAETGMGIAVVKDVAVILLFTLTLALLSSGGDTDASGGLFAEGGSTLFALFYSVLIGIPIGWLLAFITERGWAQAGWLVVGLALVVALLDPLIHLKPLFCLLAAGFVCENMWPKRTEHGTHRLETALNRVAAPVFVLFFVAAGLGLKLSALLSGWLAVVALVVVRMAAFWLAMAIGSRIGKADAQVQRYGWLTMMPQAGVTLGLAAILKDRLPDWGASLESIVVACVAIHELLGPIVLTWVLNKTGEARVQGGGAH